MNDLMYVKTNKLGWEKNHRILNTGAENSGGNQGKELKISSITLNVSTIELIDQKTQTSKLKRKHAQTR